MTGHDHGALRRVPTPVIDGDRNDLGVDPGAAIGDLEQHELSSEWLADTIVRLTQQRDTLVNMAMAARQLAKPEAATQVADRCMALGGLS